VDEVEVKKGTSGPESDETFRDKNGTLRNADGTYATDDTLSKPELNRPSLRADTKRKIEDSALKDGNGNFVDSKGNVISDYHYGHTAGHENRRILAAADELKLTQSQLNDYVNARPEYFKIEDAKRNLSHIDELKGKDNIDHIIIDMENFFGL